MADGTIGCPAVYGTTYYMDSTTHLTILSSSAATISGTLYKVDIYTAAAGSVLIKVFRDDGTNYVFVGQCNMTGLSSGLNSGVMLSSPFKVKKGDLMGFYATKEAAAGVRLSASSNNMVNKSGDITSTTAKSGWTTVSYIGSILGYIKPPSQGGFSGVSNPWIFFKDAFENNKKLWQGKKLLLPKDLGFEY